MEEWQASMLPKISGSIKWSNGEQSTAVATATDATLLVSSGKFRKQSYMSGMLTTGKTLVLSFSYVHLEEVPLRYSLRLRPIVEFELAAKEQMKITELRISKLFTANATSASTTKTPNNADVVTKSREDCMNVTGGHLTTAKEPPEAEPGIYRISFDTGKYNPDGFFPYVGIVFEVKESQKWDHFHVPLLLSPFLFSTYRGS